MAKTDPQLALEGQMFVTPIRDVEPGERKDVAPMLHHLNVLRLGRATTM
jgi:hypothetical protein